MREVKEEIWAMKPWVLKVFDKMSQRDMCKETKNKNSTKKIIRKIKLECKINYKTKKKMKQRN
jgi:hypothetical protein